MNSDVQGMTMEGHVVKQGESGLSVRKYSQANGINEHTFRYWKTKLEKSKAKGGFKLVETNHLALINPTPIMSLMYPNKTELHIYSALDAEYIRQLM